MMAAFVAVLVTFILAALTRRAAALLEPELVLLPKAAFVTCVVVLTLAVLSYFAVPIVVVR